MSTTDDAAPPVDVDTEVGRAAREDAPRALATLVRVLGDVGAAEDAVQEALATALVVWADRGVPDEPAAWLTTTARNRAYDRLRREARRSTKEEAAVRDLPPPAEVVLHPVADDQLRLLFTCAHPALGPDAQLVLMLRLVCGLSTEQIARSCLVAPATAAQRLVRAKRKIRSAAVPFRVPDADELPPRLSVVLTAIEQVFTRGYAPVAGPQIVDVDLCDEGLRLARLVTELLPDAAEPRALLALLLLQDSRRDARADAGGRLVPLDEQDRSRWDADGVAAGLAELSRATTATTAGAGAYLLQATIAAEHATATTVATTRWDRIVATYDRLLAIRPSPVAALARAVAVSYRDGPAVALPLVDVLADVPNGLPPHRVAAARADLLERLGRREEAVRTFHDAAAVAPPGPERSHLAHRAERLTSGRRR